jgi:diguanylate cyclase (GGDEF)-like protein
VEDQPHILIVEDDTSIATMVSVVLEEEGWQITVRHRGIDAKPLLARDAFDVLLLDKNLPDISGLELLEHAKERDPDVEAIIMTAHADMRSVLRALESGAYDYLVKPFGSIDEISHTVTKALERRRMRLENQRLIADLREANSQLQRINESLEEIVAQRTRQLERLSLTDDVTGLYNQRFLHRRIEEEYHRAARYERHLSVLILDLDYFKAVNDTHNHMFGSAVLRHVGGVLRDNVREVDLPIRYGGDEFVIILPETDAQGAAVAAERVRRALETAEVGQPGTRCRVTASIGLAALEECRTENAQGLLQAADRALYAAKAAGRNCVFCMRSDTPEWVGSPE